ncbi:MAG: ATP-binding protein [Candidatus Hydrogenedentes bacterium]|nr:ATP-binding protein [Candidatus Hydrogenedentota bacterium]
MKLVECLEEADSYIRLQVRSSRQAVNRALVVARGFLKRAGLPLSPNFEVVARELLENAVVHGNGNEMSCSVCFSLRVEGEAEILVEVEDEGRGFDYGALDLTIPLNPQRSGKRGLALVNALSERLEFNAKGNRVAAYLALKQEGN